MPKKAKRSANTSGPRPTYAQYKTVQQQLAAVSRERDLLRSVVKDSIESAIQYTHLVHEAERRMARIDGLVLYCPNLDLLKVLASRCYTDLAAVVGKLEAQRKELDAKGLDKPMASAYMGLYLDCLEKFLDGDMKALETLRIQASTGDRASSDNFKTLQVEKIRTQDIQTHTLPESTPETT